MGRQVSVERPPMDETIARMNIEHFRKRLATEDGETTRHLLLRLSAEEKGEVADPATKASGVRLGRPIHFLTHRAA